MDAVANQTTSHPMVTSETFHGRKSVTGTADELEDAYAELSKRALAKLMESGQLGTI